MDFFSDIIGGISDTYKEVSGFFDDILGEDALKSFGKDVVGGIFSDDSKGSTSSSKSNTSLDNEVGPMAQLRDIVKKKDSPKAVDYQTISNEWIQRMYQMTKKA